MLLLNSLCWSTRYSFYFPDWMLTDLLIYFFIYTLYYSDYLINHNGIHNPRPQQLLITSLGSDISFRLWLFAFLSEVSIPENQNRLKYDLWGLLSVPKRCCKFSMSVTLRQVNYNFFQLHNFQWFLLKSPGIII